MVIRDYELLTLREVREPSSPAYICRPHYHYTDAERVFWTNWHHRAHSLGPGDARTLASLSNWITTLIKLKKYGEAEIACRAALNTLKDADESPYFIVMKCNLAAYLVLSKQKEEASRVLDYLRQRHMLVQFDITAEAYFEALSMTCRTGRDCMVLRESDDRAPGMVRVYNYTTQGNDRNTAEGERKSLLDQDNLAGRRENIFSARLSKTINSHTVQHCLRSLRRTASLLRRPSQINWLAPTAVSLEIDVPQEADARLDRFAASTSPTNHNPLAALVDAFGFKVDQQASDHQVTKIAGTIVHTDTRAPSMAQTAPRPPATHSPPESQVFRAYTTPPLDQTFIQTPKQHDKRLVSSPTANPVQKPQAADENSKVEAWLEREKTTLPIPDMFSMAESPSRSTDALIGLTYRTNDTIGSSQVADVNPENLLPVTVWASGGSVQVQINVLLDDGASKNCVSEEFYEAINATIDTERIADLAGADGRRLQVLGRVTVFLSWEGLSGTKIKKIPCYVVKDLEMAMLICHAYILTLQLRGSPAMQAPILSSRTKQAKLDDDKKSREIAAVAIVREQQEEARRKADRKKLEDSHLGTHNLKSSGTTGSLSSLVGGSETTAASRSSSMTGLSSSITGRNTPQSQTSSSLLR